MLCDNQVNYGLFIELNKQRTIHLNNNPAIRAGELVDKGFH